MLRGVRPEDVPAEDVPAEVVDDVARTIGAHVAVTGRLAGGVNAGAVRVQVGGEASGVLKAVARTRAHQLEELERAQRIVEHMRARGYPTPAWLAMGATATHVWHLVDFVDAAPASRLTASLVEQLMEINDLQAGQGSEVHDHERYAWRVVTGGVIDLARLSRYSSASSALVERLLLPLAEASSPPAGTDMVHADLNPSNVLVRDGLVVAIVDIENAGRGTRATDLVTLQWHTFHGPLDCVRTAMWTKVVDLVGWERTAMLTATQVLLQLEWRIRLARTDAVAEVIDRGHRALDELDVRR